jgi:hypothetical protein
MRYDDVGLTPGSTATYPVVATDPSGTASDPSTAATVVVASADDAYRQRVLADAPRLYWPLDDQADRVAGSLVVAGGGGRYTSGGVTRGVPGALQGVAGDTAVTLDGSSGMARGRVRAVSPSTFSLEIWFKGPGSGKLLGYGSNQVQLSGYADRLLYVDSSGRLAFGMYDDTRARHVVHSTVRVDDDQWHHGVATFGSGGMRLYLDGVQVYADPVVRPTFDYDGAWQVGGDRLTGWPANPSSSWYAGTVDEMAVYLRELDASTVAQHHALASGS